MRMGFPVLVIGAAALCAGVGAPHWLDEDICAGGRPSCAFPIECRYVGPQGWRRYFPSIEPDQEVGCSQVMLLPLVWPLFTWNPIAKAPKHVVR